MPSPGRELVVDTSADDVVGDPRGYVRADGGARRSGQERGVARISQIHVEIFELAAPVARELPLDAAADRPANPRVAAGKGRGDSSPRRIESGEEHAGLDRTVGKTAGRIKQRGGSDQE